MEGRTNGGRIVKRCMCEWPDGCVGTGTLYCDGCGGDQCLCRCGGELPCDGCDECQDEDLYWDDEEAEAAS